MFVLQDNRKKKNNNSNDNNNNNKHVNEGFLHWNGNTQEEFIVRKSQVSVAKFSSRSFFLLSHSLEVFHNDATRSLPRTIGYSLDVRRSCSFDRKRHN